MKLVFADIEPLPMEALRFQAKTRYVPHEQITHGTSLACAAWAVDDGAIESVRLSRQVLRDDSRNDEAVVRRLHKLLMTGADGGTVFVGQNIDRFDIRKIEARCIYYRLDPLPPLQTIDTLKQARKFGFDYHRLDYLDWHLHGKGKVRHRGFPMWRDIATHRSGPDVKHEALREMTHYCEGDIECLRRVFTTLRPHFKQFPNQAIGTAECCPNCGSKCFRSNPSWWTDKKVGRYPRYRCSDCGKWFTGTHRIARALVA